MRYMRLGFLIVLTKILWSSLRIDYQRGQKCPNLVLKIEKKSNFWQKNWGLKAVKEVEDIN